MIRDAREDLGLSHTRLADLVGRSPSIVRAWERGHATPEETTVLSSLAAVLGLEERALFQAAGVAPPGPRSARTLEQTLSEIAPSALGAPPRPASADRQSSAGRSVGTPLAAAPQEELAARPVFAGSEPVRRGDHRPPSKVDLVLGRIARWSDAARGAFSGRRAPRRPAAQSQPLVLPSTARSYVEVPEQRLLYRMRSVFVAIGLAVLVIVFVWAAKEFLDAAGASLDAIFGPE
jgi:transcriptional regulator with XRE-family HTH domain